jgi:hypothetical protein
MKPLTFLILLIGITLWAIAVQRTRDLLHRRRLAALAHRWNMHYAPTDRFKLAASVAEQLPEPGAADVLVKDLIYGSEGDTFRYLLTAEYTIGVVRAKRRRRQVCTFRETRVPGGGSFSPLVLAPQDRGVVEQYEYLHQALDQNAVDAETQRRRE